MITLFSLFFLCLLFAAIAFWQSNARARERANQVAEQLCEREQLQLLDGTTVLSRIRLRRDFQGKLTIVRQFQFDFYNNAERLMGKITLSDGKITDIYIEKPLPDAHIKPTDLFTSANEVSNVITFPGSHKKDP